MNTNKLSDTLKTFTFILTVFAITACNLGNKNESNDNSTEVSQTISENGSIPDSVVQFLITSAATDFHTHQPPTPTDFRSVQIGYLKAANNDKNYILCGEFLSKENKEWVEFATIKTSGYEQYIGKTQYCQDAIMVLTNKTALSNKLKSKFEELRNNKN
ncbi:hypothetical protein FAM09_15735 [Niastella caeni]|uniref:Lipoprotein n=1 Tax=Niastella caeni TaxID=2569763 RepID=A0A4S8HRQ9_9BACT|nr:hypothetical protein [Niastella caeni]THU38133.1 hypothetical protein FAM09_15735 [Niastella caeni]